MVFKLGLEKTVGFRYVAIKEYSKRTIEAKLQRWESMQYTIESDVLDWIR